MSKPMARLAILVSMLAGLACTPQGHPGPEMEGQAPQQPSAGLGSGLPSPLPSAEPSATSAFPIPRVNVLTPLKALPLDQLVLTVGGSLDLGVDLAQARCTFTQGSEGRADIMGSRIVAKRPGPLFVALQIYGEPVQMLVAIADTLRPHTSVANCQHPPDLRPFQPLDQWVASCDFPAMDRLAQEFKEGRFTHVFSLPYTVTPPSWDDGRPVLVADAENTWVIRPWIRRIWKEVRAVAGSGTTTICWPLASPLPSRVQLLGDLPGGQPAPPMPTNQRR